MGADGAFDRRRKELALIAGKKEEEIPDEEVVPVPLSHLAPRNACYLRAVSSEGPAGGVRLARVRVGVGDAQVTRVDEG